MKKAVKILIIGLTVLIALSSCANTVSPKTEDSVEKNEPISAVQINQRELICLDFVLNNMTDENGGIRTNYLEKKKNESLATGSQVLSESMGIIMSYAAINNDKMLFEKSYGYVKNILDSGEIFSYRYDGIDNMYYVNAFVDDMRIISALINAGEVFGEEYLNDALIYADRLYDTNVKKNKVFDMYDEKYDINNDFITLCYVDFAAVKKLSEYEPMWQKVYDEMINIVIDGYMSDDVPLFSRSYNYKSGTYSEDTVNMIENLLTVYHLVGTGECPEQAIEFVRDELKKGAVYANYTVDGQNANKIESTAAYALCALIAEEIGDKDLYDISIENMLKLQVMDESSEVYGAFANAQTLDLYSFDNLMALLAMTKGNK